MKEVIITFMILFALLFGLMSGWWDRGHPGGSPTSPDVAILISIVFIVACAWIGSKWLRSL